MKTHIFYPLVEMVCLFLYFNIVLTKLLLIFDGFCSSDV